MQQMKTIYTLGVIKSYIVLPKANKSLNTSFETAKTKALIVGDPHWLGFNNMKTFSRQGQACPFNK